MTVFLLEGFGSVFQHPANARDRLLGNRCGSPKALRQDELSRMPPMPRSVNAPDFSVETANIRCADSLMAALVAAGVRHCVISSGARSAPLMLSASRNSALRIWAHPDERSAGFWALGIGKALRRPAALICTSGTAGANYYPAIIEAHYSRTPLIVVTADRPPRLRGRGAPQTIDQVGLYGRFPLTFRDLPVPFAADESPAAWYREAREAVRTATARPQGPVHLNAPFDEPLVPAPAELAASGLPSHVDNQVGQAKVAAAPPESATGNWDAVLDSLTGADRVLVICGPQNDDDDLRDQVGRLVSRMGWPVLADVAAQVRGDSGPDWEACTHYDLYLRTPRLAKSLRPDVVIRVGGLPTSKILSEWLAQSPDLEYVAIETDLPVADPYGNVTISVVCEPGAACALLGERLGDPAAADTTYRRLWSEAEARTRACLAAGRRERADGPPFEGDIAAAVVQHAPADAILYLSSSLAIRMADAYGGTRSGSPRVLVNRGANGIDGVVSSAAGAAAASGRPTVLLIGDMAFHHDLNGLWGVAREALPLKIVLINNDGGGIFSFLPLAAHTEIFESLVAMPHGHDFAHAARFFGVPHTRSDTAAQFAEQYRSSLARPGPEIIEVRTERQHTYETSRRIAEQVAEAVRGIG